MIFKVEIMPQARLELIETAEFIAMDNPVRADAFIDSLVSHFTETLSVFPESGMIYKRSSRKISFRGHTAFYSINRNKKLVEIFHIVDLTKPLDSRDMDF